MRMSPMKEPIILVLLRINSSAASITTMEFQSKGPNDVMVMRRSLGARPHTRASSGTLMIDRDVARWCWAVAGRVGMPPLLPRLTMQA